MKDFSKPLKDVLDKNGWTFLRQGSRGSHEIWQSPDGSNTVTVNNGMKSRHTANKILTKAGLKERFRSGV